MGTGRFAERPTEWSVVSNPCAGNQSLQLRVHVNMHYYYAIFMHSVHVCTMQLHVYSMSQKSVTLTISENIPKPRNTFWMVCSDAWENLHQTHMCSRQGLGVYVQLKKFQNWFRGFGIFSEIVRVTLFFGDIQWHLSSCCYIRLPYARG